MSIKGLNLSNTRPTPSTKLLLSRNFGGDIITHPPPYILFGLHIHRLDLLVSRIERKYGWKALHQQ